MNRAITISRTLLLTSALTLCMGGTRIVYAESNGAGKGLTGDEARQVHVVELDQLRPDIAEGDDMGILFENLAERPMSVLDVPETPEESQEFQGYESGA